MLPYKNQTLIGTTEERQKLSETIKPSEKEIDYLMKAYNDYFKEAINKQDIIRTFSGIHPLIKSSNNPNKATREYALQKNGKVISVFGGKWTTSRSLAKKIVKSIVI